MAKTKWQYGTIDSKSGGVLRTSETPTHTLVFLNGRSEWIEKYDHLWPYLRLKKDTQIITWDHKGQGKSEGQRAHIDSYDEFISDGKQIIDQVAGESYTIMAHSMGSLITLYGTLKGQFRPDSIILGSPLLMLPDSPLKRNFYIPVAKFASYLNLGRQSPGVGGGEEEYFENPVTRSYDGYRKIGDSSFSSISPTFGWVAATSDALKFVHDSQNIAKLSCPALILGGGQESVVDYKGFSQWVRSASESGSQAVKFVNIPGARHELFNEIPETIESVVLNIKNWHKSQKIKHSVF